LFPAFSYAFPSLSDIVILPVIVIAIVFTAAIYLRSQVLIDLQKRLQVVAAMIDL
tara:strand:- start:1083 stop:1247 length:165 start_codon:yes stop_codon:yes gene_type:complete